MIRRRRGSGSQGAIAAISPGSAHKGVFALHPSPRLPGASTRPPPFRNEPRPLAEGPDTGVAAAEARRVIARVPSLPAFVRRLFAVVVHSVPETSATSYSRVPPPPATFAVRTRDQRRTSLA